MSHQKSTSTKWYQETWLTLVTLVLFFPAGLFLMWRYRDWQVPVKLGVTGLFVVLIVVAAVVGGDEEELTAEERAARDATQAAEKTTDAATEVYEGTVEALTKRTLDASARATEDAERISGVGTQTAATMEEALARAEATRLAAPTATPTPCPDIPEILNGTVNFCSDRHLEIFQFYLTAMRVVAPSDANQAVWQEASEFARLGSPNVYDYYSLVVRVGELHHDAADQIFSLSAPDGLGDARDTLYFALKNRGDAMSHLADFINTGDLEELRQAEIDYGEADSAVFAGLAEIASVAEESGLSSVWLLESVECSDETQTCGPTWD